MRLTRSVVFVLVAFTSAAALAQGPSPKPGGVDPGVESKRLYNEGTQAYNLGEFGRAVDLFKQAYKVKPDPVFLFNIAQSLRLNNQYGEAAFFYKSFLRNMPQAPNKAEVEGRIKEMEDAEAKAKADAAEKARLEQEEKERKEREERERKNIPDPGDVTIDDNGRQLPDGDTKKPIYKKWWFWTGVGVVAVGAVAAVVLLTGDPGEVSPPDSTFGNSQVFK